MTCREIGKILPNKYTVPSKYRREKSMSMKTKKLNVLTAYLKLFLKSL